MKKGKFIVALIICFVLAAVVRFVILPQTAKKQDDNKEIITVSTLENIINVSKLSTFTAIYNGIAQVMNDENPDQIDYYVSYEATVKIGIDFDKVDINVDNDKKVISITIPPLYITDPNVNIASLDYIFVNDKANTSSVSQEAFKACEADVRNECEQEDVIFELAAKNVKNILTALIRPIIDQLYADYTLEIE